jgi:hypothetical protein
LRQNDRWHTRWQQVQYLKEVDVERTNSDSHQHTPKEEHEIREAALDETLEGTFPASDPPSSVPNPDDHDAAARQKRRRNASQNAGRAV